MSRAFKTFIPMARRISVRLMVIIVVILAIGVGLTIVYYLTSQNLAVIDSRETALQEESEVLYMAIKNAMLAGEAPLAVDLIQSIRQSALVKDIRLYRADGDLAFSDNRTLMAVNATIGEDRFQPKTTFITGPPLREPRLREAVDRVIDVSVRRTAEPPRTLTIYKPLINQPRCAGCHGTDHVVRGVIRVSSSLDTVYAQTLKNVYVAGGIYAAVVAVLSILMLAFIRRVIITRILDIGAVAERVGAGDFKTEVRVRGADEISQLGLRINGMIEGLNERFKLSRFVSRSTLAHIQGSDEIVLGGEKRRLTVLFSDIRGFTQFSEARDPEAVIQTLNEVMRLQAEIVNQFDGDIDKFVGDELMAIFEGDEMVQRAARAAESIRNALQARARTTETPICVGIGINTGEMISGNMGSMGRMDRTVIGDAVNLGARLCAAAGKDEILLSEESYRQAADQVIADPRPPIHVKGKSAPVIAYALRETRG